MQGVKFNKVVSPYQPGDVAMLSDEAAQAVIQSGEASPCVFPAAPHATGVSDVRSEPEPALRSASERPSSTYRTKRR